MTRRRCLSADELADFVRARSTEWGTNTEGDPIWLVNYGGPGTLGGGYGGSISYYDTYTWVQRIGHN